MATKNHPPPPPPPWAERLWNRLWPQACLLCGADCTMARRLCDGCLRDLPRIHNACPRCARPVTGDLDPLAGQAAAKNRIECGACQLRPPPFETSFIPYRYAPPLDQLICQFKFNGKLEIAPLLAELLYAATPTDGRPDLLIPIPLHGKRLNKRGFNQALELARHLRRLTAVPCDYNTLERVRHTAQQTALDQKARLTNVAGAFAARRGLADMRVALIDDVVTTGATVAEAASALLNAGASKVEIWAVARTP